MSEMSEHTYTIRAAEPGDMKEIMRAHRRSILVLGLSHYAQEEVESWAAGLTPDFYERALAHIGHFEVAVDPKGRVVGLGAARGAEIWLLYTDPEWAGHGIGSALLARAEAAVRKDGHEVAEVRASLNAEGFYAHHGYEAVERYDHKTRGGMMLGAVRMEKKLT